MWQHGSKHVQQNVPTFHRKHAKLSSMGLQQPVPTRSTCAPQNNCNLKYSKVNSSDSAQNSGEILTSADKNVARQSMGDGGHHLKGSYFYSNERLQQLLNSDSSVNVSSAIRQEDKLGVAAQSCPSKYVGSSSVDKSQPKKSCPLLTYLLTKNDCDLSHFLPSSSERPNASVERHTGAHLMNKTHCDSEDAKSSLADQQQVYSPSASAWPLADNMPLLTDEQILSYITERVKEFRTIICQQTRAYGGNPHKKDQNIGSSGSLWSACTPFVPKSSSVSTPRATSHSVEGPREKQVLNCSVTQQCRATAGQRSEGDSPKDLNTNAVLTLQRKENDGCSSSKKRSTGTLISAVEGSCDTRDYKCNGKTASVDLDKNILESREGQINTGDSGNDKLCVINNDESSLHARHHKTFKMTTLHYSLTALKELIASLENVETIAETDDFSAIIAKRYWNGDKDNIHLFASTEYPEIMLNVAATCTKNEDESPVVLTTMSGTTLEDLTEKPPKLTPDPSSEEAQYTSVWLNATNGDDVSKHPDVCQDFQHGQQSPAGQSMTLLLKGHQTKSRPLVSEDKQLELSMQLESQQTPLKDAKFQAVRADTVSVHSETGLNGSPPENEGTELPVLSVNARNRHISLGIKDPQYEDVTDDENMLLSQLASKVSKTGCGGSSLRPCFKDPQYDDVTEDETSQMEETVPVTPVSQSNGEECLEDGNGGGQVDLKMNLASDKASDSTKTESPDLARNSFSCGLHAVLKAEDESEDRDSDAEWDVIPLLISDLTLEPAGSQDGPENDVLDELAVHGQSETISTACEPQLSVSEPEAASTSFQLPLFNTIESYLESHMMPLSSYYHLDLVDSNVPPSRGAPEHEVDADAGALHAPHSREQDYSETENSCETEDSCDYSSSPEKNILTVPRRLLRKKSETATLLSSETEDSMSEKGDDVTNVQKDQYGTCTSLKTQNSGKSSYMQKLREFIKAKADSKQRHHKAKKRKIPKKENIVSLDSDTEDEWNQSFTEKRKRKRLSSPGLEDSNDIPPSQRNGPSAESLGSYCGTDGDGLQETGPSECSPQRPSHLSHPAFKDSMVAECSDQSQSMRQLIKGKEDSDSVQYKAIQKTVPDEIIILDSDTDDENAPVCTKTVKRRLSESSDILVTPHNSSLPEAVSSDGQSGEDQPQRPTQTFEDSSDQHVQPLEQMAKPRLLSNSILTRLLFCDADENSDYLKLSNISTDKSHKDGVEVPNNSLSTSERTDSCKKDMLARKGGKKSKGPHQSLDKRTVVSRPRSLSNHEGASSYSGGLLCSDQPIPETRKASSKDFGQSREHSSTASVPRAKQNLAIPRQNPHTAKLQRSHSYSSHSNSDHLSSLPETSSVLTSHSARKQVISDWSTSYIPTWRDRKTSQRTEGDSRTSPPHAKNTAEGDLWVERRQAATSYEVPLRHKHRSESIAPLMKKSLSLAKRCTKASHRETPNDQRYSVGEGYKWSEKTTMASKAKGTGSGKKKS